MLNESGLVPGHCATCAICLPHPQALEGPRDEALM